jgi:hypothetical protein
MHRTVEISAEVLLGKKRRSENDLAGCGSNNHSFCNHISYLAGLGYLAYSIGKVKN